MVSLACVHGDYLVLGADFLKLEELVERLQVSLHFAENQDVERFFPQVRLRVLLQYVAEAAHIPHAYPHRSCNVEKL